MHCAYYIIIAMAMSQHSEQTRLMQAAGRSRCEVWRSRDIYQLMSVLVPALLTSTCFACLNPGSDDAHPNKSPRPVISEIYDTSRREVRSVNLIAHLTTEPSLLEQDVAISAICVSSFRGSDRSGSYLRHTDMAT